MSPVKKKWIRSAWNDIVEAVKGSQQDFTSINLPRAIFLLSIPMVLEMVMESVFAIVDIFFVSQVGPTAVAAVGITESLMYIMYSVAAGLSAATTAMVSRRIGEKNPEGAATASVQAIFAGAGVSLIFVVVGILFAPDLLRIMGASPEVIESGYMYTGIIMGTNTVIMVLFIINAVFRSAGDAAYAMRVLWLGNGLNLILDPCLIFGLGPFPELGVAGAAVATSIGRGIAVLYQLYLLFVKGKGRVNIRRRHLKFDFGVMKRLVRISFGGIFQALISTSSWIGMVRIIAEFGSNALAGYTIGIRIIIFSLLPSWGLSNAAASLVGQNLGAKKPERSERAVWITSIINTGLLGTIGLIFVLFPQFFIRIFINDPAVIATGAVCLRWVSFGFLTYGVGMVVVQSFNGAGDTMTPTWINVFCFWLVEIPLAWVLALPMGVGEKGVYIAIVVAETLMALLGIILFRRGKWKQQVV